MRRAQAMGRVVGLVLLGLLAKGAAAAEVRLADGRVVALAGVEVAQAELAALGELGLGEGVRLLPETPPQDRYGRLRAQVRAADGTWVQGELVRRGLAVVAPVEDVADGVLAELLALERAAREAGRGLWGHGAVGPWPAERVAGERWRYLLVRGRVLEVAPAQDFVYLNFGRRWREDFTVRAPAALARRLARHGLDLAQLEGREVLVRGVLFDTHGPMIELAHRLQLEVLP